MIGGVVGANASDVEIFFDLSRRLKASLRRLASFRVNYIVTFPTGIDPVAKAALLSDVTAPVLTSAINSALTDELGANAPVVTVTSHAAAAAAAASAAVVHIPTTTVAGTTAVASNASSTVTTTVSIAGTPGTRGPTATTTKDLLSSLFDDIVASAAGHTPQFMLTFVLMFFCRSVHQA